LKEVVLRYSAIYLGVGISLLVLEVTQTHFVDSLC